MVNGIVDYFRNLLRRDKVAHVLKISQASPCTICPKIEINYITKMCLVFSLLSVNKYKNDFSRIKELYPFSKPNCHCHSLSYCKMVILDVELQSQVLCVTLFITW